jgi:NAD(P)-dependent dehydrogenase (short-subunit alcohol dehydrogenase family)
MVDRKTVLITGASGDIGLSLCEGFKDEGWKVVAIDKIPLKSTDVDYFFEFDLELICNEADYCENKIREIKRVLPDGLNVLINNAALQIVKPIKEVSLKDWKRTLDTNLTAPFILSMSFLDELKAAKGSIINISSIHARLTKPNFVAYAVSKSGLLGMTKSLAVEIGRMVRVNSISPAAINTKMLEDGFTDNSEGLKNLADYHPSKSIGFTKDVFDAAKYLAYGDKFVNGVDITLDGAISSRLHDPS